MVEGPSACLHPLPLAAAVDSGGEFESDRLSDAPTASCKGLLVYLRGRWSPGLLHGPRDPRDGADQRATATHPPTAENTSLAGDELSLTRSLLR